MKFKWHHGESAFVLLTAVLLALFFIIPSGGTAITVKPGRLDHFAVSAPDVCRAGEEFQVELRAYDKYENLITNFPAEAGKDIAVSLTGSAEARPGILKASAFTDGSTRITVFDKKAETVVLTLHETGATVALYTKEIRILANKLDHFVIKSPEGVQAGKGFEVKITAKDAFDNIVGDEGISKDIRISSSGQVELKYVTVPTFKDGSAVMSLSAEKAGMAAIEVRDMAKGVASKGPAITISPSSLDHFNVSAPDEVEAGAQFSLVITAVDAFNNIASNYSSYGAGVNISSSGRSGVSPSYIRAADFKDGRASISLAYEKAEDINLAVKENGGAQEGKSPLLRVSPSGLEKLVIITPEDAVAGQKFRLKIEAYDRFGNLMKNYNLKGADVTLKTSGSGALTPNTVPASEFIDGAASFDVSYDKAESFTISALTALKDRTPQVVERPAKKPSTPAVSKPVREVKAEKPAVKADAPKDSGIKKPKKAEPQGKAVKKEEQVKKEPTKKDVEVKVFEVSDINVIEAQNKAMFIISIPNINSNLKYREGLESSGGKDWVRVRLSPAVSKVMGKPLKFKSVFIGDIKVRQGAGGEIDVLFELLPVKVKYDIEKTGDSLIITITSL